MKYKEEIEKLNSIIEDIYDRIREHTNCINILNSDTNKLEAQINVKPLYKEGDMINNDYIISTVELRDKYNGESIRWSYVYTATNIKTYKSITFLKEQTFYNEISK